MFGNKKGLEKELRESGGAEAWATVLEGKEKWSSTNRGFRSTTFTEHMRLKLRVEPEGQPPFEAEFSQAFHENLPMSGFQCKVIYDPDDHSRIAVIDGTAHPPGITHEQAARVTERRTAMLDAAKSGHLAEYVEQMKEQAMRGQLGGTVIMGGQVIPQAGQPVAAPAPTESVADQLAKLADLKDRGALTDAEFAAQKAKLLGSI